MSERPYTKEEVEANRRQRQQERKEQQKRAGSNRSTTHTTGPRLIPAADFVAGYQPPAYLIDGIAQKARFYSLTANTSHGKTAVALCMAIYQALERSIAGHATYPSKVIYLAAENPDDIKARMVLIAHRLMLDLPNLPLWFVEDVFNIEEALDRLDAEARVIGGADVVYGDTSAAFYAASGFHDENDNAAAYKYASQQRRITTIAGNPAVIMLCHPTKSATREMMLPRGGGAYLNETDGNFTLWANDDRTITELSWGGKFRGATFDPLTFAMEKDTCPGLVDASGRPVSSVWAYPAKAEAAEKAEERERGEQDSLLLMILKHPGQSLASYAKLLRWTTKSGEPNKQRVDRLMKTLVAARLVHQARKGWKLTERGKKEALEVEDNAHL